MIIDQAIQLVDLKEKLDTLWELSGQKILSIEKTVDAAKGAPVFTIEGTYTSQGWTEWTQGFQYGSAALQFDATGDEQFLEICRKNTLAKMAPHLTHTGVHDHGFNNYSTYGNLLRLAVEGKFRASDWEKESYTLAIKVSGAVQASRWTEIQGGGFMYSFNGPHSLFVDTIRTCRILVLSHCLGHKLFGENDRQIDLLHRAIQHLVSTAKYSVFYGEGRDRYDVRGRTAHEIIFNVKDGNYRCPNSQQGFSGFTTWTRGLAWAICGFGEILEFLDWFDDWQISEYSKSEFEEILLKGALATADFYLENTPSDGIPYWDAGAPNLHKLGDYLNQPADPFNDYEPVDSSAAAIAAQGFLRIANVLKLKNPEAHKRYYQTGIQLANRLFERPYLSENPNHQGLILHSIYHHPNGWDHIPKGSKIPNGESSMWGDYHARELALMLTKSLKNEPYYAFFNCLK